MSLKQLMKEYKIKIITETIEKHGGNKSKAARELKMAYQNLQHFLYANGVKIKGKGKRDSVLLEAQKLNYDPNKIYSLDIIDKEIYLNRLTKHDNPKTLEAIANQFGLTREAIRQRQKRIIEGALA